MKNFKYLAMLLSILTTGAIVAEVVGSYKEQQPTYQKQSVRSHVSQHQMAPEQSSRQIDGVMMRDDGWRSDREDDYVIRRDYDRDRYDRYGRYDRYDRYYYDDPYRRRVGDSRVFPWNW